MSKKTFTLFIVFVALIVVCGFLWWQFLSDQPLPFLGERDSSGQPIFFPFGGSAGEGGEPTDTGSLVTNDGPVPRLRQISPNPVAGFTVFTDENQGVVIRFAERATGHTFETTATSLTTRRLTNTTIPKVYEAVWLSRGSAVIARYLQDDEVVKSFYASLPEDAAVASGTGELNGIFLPDNIKDLAVSPTGNEIFYVIRGASGASGFVANPHDDTRATVFTSPLSEWLLAWPNDNRLSLTTKPASRTPGFSYSLPARGGVLEREIGDKRGLTVLPKPNSRAFLYTENDGERLVLTVHDPEKGSVVAPLATFVEKCVWSAAVEHIIYCGVPTDFIFGEYPDLWYQGISRFTDDLWKINVTTGETTLLFSLNEFGGKEMDIDNPALDLDEEYLFFTNRNDLTLWAFRI